MASLAEIRAKLAQAGNNNSRGNFNSDNTVFPHWNINEGDTVNLRFLPDADPNNTFFWVERLMIRLPFNGIKGEANSSQVTVQVPCVEMWGQTCPILTEVRTWFKDSSLEEMGRKYWKKKTYIYQGFVHNNPLDEESPENPIRRFMISPQLQNIIKSALMDPELEDLPTDYASGLDFKIVKTQKGGYADYSTSAWARKTTSLTEEEAKAIDTHGLYDLKTFLPKQPDETALSVMKEMFEASVDGQPYDAERWSQYFRPPGVRAPDNANAPVAAAKPTEPVAAAKTETPVDTAPTKTPVDTATADSDSGSKAEDILAMIRSRQS